MLTPREIEVLAALRHGDRTSAARGLGMSVHTLDNHLRRIKAKLEVDTVLQAYDRALALGLMHPPRRAPRRRRRDAASSSLWEKVA